MNKRLQILLALSVVLVTTQTHAQVPQPWPFWEFNTDGDNMGWGPTGNGQITGFQTMDGALHIDIVANAGDPFFTSPLGPYESAKVTGFLAKMRHTADPSGGGGRQFFMFPQGAGHQFIGWDPPAKNPQDGVVYVDLATEPPEKWVENPLIRHIRFDFSNLGEAYTVSIDWIRPEGLYIQNETFSFWDFQNDKIANWELIGDAANFNFDEQEIVDSLNFALALTGSGTDQGVSQAIKGAAEMEFGNRIVAMGAINVPAGAWDANSKLTVRLRETSAGDEVVTDIEVAVTESDGYVDFNTGPFASLGVLTAERTGASIEILVNSTAGQVVYLDSLFVNVLPPVRTTGWPVNCVQLAAGQSIAIDGVVSAAEYQGAQAVTINADTVGGVDPHFPLKVHETKDLNLGQWGNTPVEDFSATYYTMWNAEALYVAVSCEDDSYQFMGPEAFAGDALQFTLSQSPFVAEYGNLYIPTIAPADADGNTVAANALRGPFLQTDLFAHAGTEVAGAVDASTQNWSVEVKIPWAAMQDLVGVPPAIGDTMGFNILAIDYDTDGEGNPQLQVLSSTHADDWPWAPWPFGAADAPSQETMTFVGP